jgi:hypothetical protein
MARKQKCRCQDAQQYTNPVKKNTLDLSAYFPFITVPLQIAFDFVTDLATSGKRKVSSKEVAEGECPSCGGSGYIDDYTDSGEQVQAVAREAQALQKEILDFEAKLGPTGGNQHVMVAGDAMLEVGLAYNDSQSYEIIEDASRTRAGVKMYKKGPVTVDGKINGVKGGNPLATPGGHYTIKCGNKFVVRAGAQGIELNSEGPLRIRTGQVEFTGPEITLGAAKGQLILDAQAINMNGKYVNINPDSSGSGQVSIGGTLHTTGNAVIQGGVHAEGGMITTSITTPAVEHRSRHSSQDVQTTGPATWSAIAATQAAKDFALVAKKRAVDISGLILTPRQIQNTVNDSKNLVKKSLPIEPVPTGIIQVGTPITITGTCPCNQGGAAAGTVTGITTAPIPLFNFPHHHTLSDAPHAHMSKGPNWKGLDSDEEIRRPEITNQSPIMAQVDKGNVAETVAAFATIVGIAPIRVDVG